MPDWNPELATRLRALGLPAERELSIGEEITLHLDERFAELRRAGAAEPEARRLALAELQDDERRGSGWRALAAAPPLAPPGAPSGRWRPGSLLRDARYAARTLWRQRGYTLPAVLALALGIGGTTAVFAVVDAVLLRPMPFPHADRLYVPVSVHTGRNVPRASVAFADITDWRREPGLFAEVAAWRPDAGDLTGTGDPERVQMGIVSEQFFRLIDVKPVTGRVLQMADHEPGAAQVVVISHRLWQRGFGGVPDVVGRQVVLGGVSREIVGVLPARQVWPPDMEVFVPMDTAGFGTDVRERRDNMIFNAIARLPEGVSPDQVRSRLAGMAARIERDYPRERAGWSASIVPLRDYLVDPDTTTALYVLLGAVTGVLLIACANVANLALVRGAGRARELAIRVSLGASRGRVVQQLLVEGVVLTSLGVAAGLGLAALMMSALVSMAPPGTPLLEDVALDGRVLIAAVIAGTVAAIIAGLLPAVSATGLRISTTLRDGSAGTGTSRHTARLRSALVVAEIAAAVVLVTASALLIRSFDRLTEVNPGVTTDRVVSGRIAIPGSRYETPESRLQFAEELVARLEERPDIEYAALTSFVPAGGGGFGLGRSFLAEGHSEASERAALWNTVTPRYFDTLGVRIVEGRRFDTRDRADAAPVMIVSRHFAARMFPGESAVGKRVMSSRDEKVYREIVGVADEVRYWSIAERERAPLVYVPLAQDVPFGLLVVARSRSGEAAAILDSVRRGLARVDPLMAIAELRPLEASVSRSVATERYSTLLLSVLAAVALTLSALGIYGVMSYAFELRRREMGIRLALGATQASLYALVFRHGLTLTAVGLVLGAAGAVGFTRSLEALLFDTTPLDVSAWLAMVLVVCMSAVLACLLPARRAASASAAAALRAE